jgi:16S rRNA (cytidine1402-2'-O)-methyltransferase
MNECKGILILVSTPIGNLEDVSSRALSALRNAEIVAAEDTRRTRILLTRYGISRKLQSYADHNLEHQLPRLSRALENGKSVALVSDAGTPAISDPGYKLIREAIGLGAEITFIPGPTALIAAVVVSGLPTDAFYFGGYLPRKSARRKKKIGEVKELTSTLIFYEAPHRLLPCLRDLMEILGNREAAICRELTKKHEEIQRGELDSLIEEFSSRRIRGEIVVVVEGRMRRKSG